MAQISLGYSDSDVFGQVGPIGRSTTSADVAAAELAETVDLGLVSTFADFQALERDWNALYAVHARSEHVFQSYAWNWHWCRHYLSEGRRARVRLAIVTGRIGGRLVLLLPLVVARQAGLKQLAWMGAPVTQYGDAIAAPEAMSLKVLQRAWSLAVQQTGADLANLRKVREDAIVAPLMTALGASITATEEAPYVDLSRFKSFEAFEETISQKGRKNRRRKLRRMEDLGTVTFDTHVNSDDAKSLAGYAVLLKRAWLKRRNQISPAMADDQYAAFFADAAAGGAHPTGCKVMLVRSNNEAAGMQVVLEHKGAQFLHIAVYASKYEKVGPGSILLERSIADGFRQGLKRFDFLAPKHDYKLEFTDTVVRVHDHALALSRLGQAYTKGFLGIRRELKARVEGMPAPLRRALMSAASLLKRRAT